MKNLLIALMMILPFKAYSQVTDTLVIETNSTGQSLRIPGPILGTMGSIIQKSDQTFAVNIAVQYRGANGRRARLSFSYSLKNAEFEKNGNDLYINFEGERYLVAHHRWYYSPAWQLQNGKVVIKSNREVVSSKYIKLKPTVVINF